MCFFCPFRYKKKKKKEKIDQKRRKGNINLFQRREETKNDQILYLLNEQHSRQMKQKRWKKN